MASKTGASSCGTAAERGAPSSPQERSCEPSRPRTKAFYSGRACGLTIFLLHLARDVQLKVMLGEWPLELRILSLQRTQVLYVRRRHASKVLRQT